MGKDKTEENVVKKTDDENNIFFKKRSVLMNKVLHAYNTGGGGTYDELMAITKALRYRKENLSEEVSFRRLLNELFFIEQTNKKGLSKQYKQLLNELIKEYGRPEPLDSNLVEKEMSKNQKVKKVNILVGICFILLLILIFAFLR